MFFFISLSKSKQHISVFFYKDCHFYKRAKFSLKYNFNGFCNWCEWWSVGDTNTAEIIITEPSLHLDSTTCGDSRRPPQDSDVLCLPYPESNPTEMQEPFGFHTVLFLVAPLLEGPLAKGKILNDRVSTEPQQPHSTLRSQMIFSKSGIFPLSRCVFLHYSHIS